MKNNIQNDYKSYRRLYRDTDDKILGGVCSGIGYYWRIDPLILRIVLIVSFFWAGLGFFAYIILWIVVPPAYTSAQKLEMKGEPVTADNIGRSFNDARK